MHHEKCKVFKKTIILRPHYVNNFLKIIINEAEKIPRVFETYLGWHVLYLGVPGYFYTCPHFKFWIYTLKAGDMSKISPILQISSVVFSEHLW